VPQNRRARAAEGIALRQWQLPRRSARRQAAGDPGTCRINSYNLTLVEVPFGGFKQSGSPPSITARS
jgi:hypothetical protein